MIFNILNQKCLQIETFCMVRSCIQIGVVEVTGSSIDSQTISKTLRGNSVMLNSALPLPDGNTIYVGEVVRAGNHAELP